MLTPRDRGASAGAIIVAVVMMIVVLPAAALWAGAGRLIGRVFSDARSRRAMNLVLAALVLTTIATIWW